MNVTQKSAGRPFEVGQVVRVTGRSEIYIVAAVEYIERETPRGTSRFDTYRLSLGGELLAGVYYRADLRPTAGVVVGSPADDRPCDI